MPPLCNPLLWLWQGPGAVDLLVARLPAALLVTAVFAVGARLLRAVTWGGAAAGALVSFLLWTSWPPAFAVLVAVFLLTLAATRVGYRRKQDLGTAERGDGRSASQVLANLAVAAAATAAAHYAQQPLLLVAAAAALAEAAADTVSSELGQALAGPTRLITTWQPVPPGTDGGVSLQGTLAGAAAAIVVAGVALLAGMAPGPEVAIVAVAGALGMLADSVLGALFERRRLLTNDQVNLAGTFIAAALAVLLARAWPQP